jgi:hypothetical protein
VTKTERKRVYYSGPNDVVQWNRPCPAVQGTSKETKLNQTEVALTKLVEWNHAYPADQAQQVQQDVGVRGAAMERLQLREEAVSGHSGDGQAVRGRVAGIERGGGGIPLPHPPQGGLSRMPGQEWDDLWEIDAGDEEGGGGRGQVGEGEGEGEGREGREEGEGEEGGGEDDGEGMILVDGYTDGNTDGNGGLINRAAAVAAEEVVAEAQRVQKITPHLLARLRTRSVGPGYTEGEDGAGEGSRGDSGTERETDAERKRGERGGERERGERDYVRATTLFEGLCAAGKASAEHFEVDIDIFYYYYCWGDFFF